MSPDPLQICHCATKPLGNCRLAAEQADDSCQPRQFVRGQSPCTEPLVSHSLFAVAAVSQQDAGTEGVRTQGMTVPDADTHGRALRFATSALLDHRALKGPVGCRSPGSSMQGSTNRWLTGRGGGVCRRPTVASKSNAPGHSISSCAGSKCRPAYGKLSMCATLQFLQTSLLAH